MQDSASGDSLEDVQKLVDLHARITMVKQGLVEKEKEHLSKVQQYEKLFREVLSSHVSEEGYGGCLVEGLPDMRSTSSSGNASKAPNPGRPQPVKRRKIDLEQLRGQKGDIGGCPGPSPDGEARYLVIVPRKEACSMDAERGLEVCRELFRSLASNNEGGLRKEEVLKSLRAAFTQVRPHLTVTNRRPRSVDASLLTTRPDLRDSLADYLHQKDQLKVLQVMRRETCRPYVEEKQMLQRKLGSLLSSFEESSQEPIQIICKCSLSPELHKQEYGVHLKPSRSKRTVKKITLSMIYQTLKAVYGGSENISLDRLQARFEEEMALQLSRATSKPEHEGDCKVTVGLVSGRNDPKRKEFSQQLGQMAIEHLNTADISGEDSEDGEEAEAGENGGGG